MDVGELIDVARLTILAMFLGVASVVDWRTRKVGNPYWLVLAVLGLFLLVVQVVNDDKPLEYLLVIFPIIAILLDIYLEPAEGSHTARLAPVLEYAFAIASVVVLFYLWGEDTYFQHLLAVPVIMIVFVIFYILDIVRGGADAKALISISILFPFYPELGELPLLTAKDIQTEILFPFSFIALVTAAIIVALLPIAFLLKNIVARDFRWPFSLLGYRMDIESAKGRHVWLMERIVEGRHVVYTRPKRDEDLGMELRLLSNAGHKRVWVTPKVPFIPALLAGGLFTALVGNLLLLIFAL